MASLQTSILMLLCVTLQTGLGLPLTDMPEGDEGDRSAPRVRTKRCSCTNQMDSECHYFCHLDIIWVNTPSTEDPAIMLTQPWSPEEEKKAEAGALANERVLLAFETDALANERAPLASETGALANDRAPLASRPDVLSPQKVSERVPSEDRLVTNMSDEGLGFCHVRVGGQCGGGW
ncbi:hypothetical protein ACEWY4_020488 [Coilia grayii]|uniref:Endothelin-like toxin domain-containing protein n=1 Tax=Coilia grayii TaxID=363190 RepID=A0ABD1JEH2_9TELE